MFLVKPRRRWSNHESILELQAAFGKIAEREVEHLQTERIRTSSGVHELAWECDGSVKLMTQGRGLLRQEHAAPPLIPRAWAVPFFVRLAHRQLMKWLFRRWLLPCSPAPSPDSNMA
jgi:hypothetical protein